MYHFTCTISHVQFHMYRFTCTISHVPFHIYRFTCTISHVPFHMYHFTCTISHVPFHMYNFTCTVSLVPFHMYNFTCTEHKAPNTSEICIGHSGIVGPQCITCFMSPFCRPPHPWLVLRQYCITHSAVCLAQRRSNNKQSGQGTDTGGREGHIITRKGKATARFDNANELYSPLSLNTETHTVRKRTFGATVGRWIYPRTRICEFHIPHTKLHITVFTELRIIFLFFVAPYLGAFAKLRKATISFAMSVRLSVWNNSAPTERIFMKFYIWVKA
jgi:hypothetical protein